MINDNMLTTVAEKMVGGTSYPLPSYLAFGSTTGTLSATDTSTSGEFDRNILDSDSNSLATFTYSGSRLSTEAANQRIALLSLVNSSTLRGSGDIMANFLVSSFLHTTSFDLYVTLTFTVARG